MVRGVNYSYIQQWLFAEGKLTLDSAIKLATALQSAARDSQAMQQAGLSSQGQGQVSVSAVKEKKTVSNYNTPSASRKNNIKCYRCLGPHKANVCKFKNEKLFSCSKIGHVLKPCKSKKSDFQGQG